MARPTSSIFLGVPLLKNDAAFSVARQQSRKLTGPKTTGFTLRTALSRLFMLIFPQLVMTPHTGLRSFTPFPLKTGCIRTSNGYARLRQNASSASKTESCSSLAANRLVAGLNKRLLLGVKHISRMMQRQQSLSHRMMRGNSQG